MIKAAGGDDRRTKIVANAARLLGDAKFLSDDGRFASAFALAVLAVEELGKVVLDIWEEPAPVAKPKGLNSHQRKQAAVAALLLAKRAVEEVGDANIDEPIAIELVERVAKAMYESEAGRFSQFVQMGALDKTKQLALYRDEWPEAAGLYAHQFQKSDVTDLFEKARMGIAAVAHPKIMRAGRAIYEMNPPAIIRPVPGGQVS